MKAVSVIVPCFNVEKTLERCLDSLVNQTLEELEIIAVDDGSSDGTWKILSDYQSKYPEKIRIFQKQNGGLGSARNYGLKEVETPYVGFVDSDDYVEEDMYANLYHEMLSDESDLGECDFVWEYPKKERLDQGTSYSSKEEFIAHGRILVCNKLYKTSIIRDHQLSFPLDTRYEDIPFTLHYVLYMNKYTYVNHMGYHYVQSKTSLSNFQNEKVRDIFGVLEKTIESYQSASPKEKEALEYFCTRVLLGSSYKRICKLQDKSFKEKCIEETWNNLNEWFPNWKQNPYLNGGMKNFYMKHTNLFFLKHMTFLFRR